MTIARALTAPICSGFLRNANKILTYYHCSTKRLWVVSWGVSFTPSTFVQLLLVGSDFCPGVEPPNPPGKSSIGTEVAHVICDLDTTFKIKRSKVKVTRPLCLPPCWRVRQAAAAVGVGTCWPWETAATLPSARRRKALRRPQREERGGGISWRPPDYSLLS